ncbi:MAG: hypothetical protein FJZ47_02435 [Candidatus Tectomicrobia bacterium]|uniref:Uncharacterized protein n=1 Tax=Tectimicrobiota bacterium TaxID=2528274 RepID=A0A937VX46_UNCTE|nr:hypothetical protein [Candidatus Tectomicrobia bacterium]
MRARLDTLLRLDTIHRQTSLRGYLTTHLQRPPQEVEAVMAHIRHDTVAARLLAMLEGQPSLAAPGHRLSLEQPSDGTTRF